MATTALKCIRTGVLAVALAASAATGTFSFAPSAEARVPEGATGKLASDCKFLQDMWDYWFKKAQSSKQGSAEYYQAIDRYVDNEKAWKEKGCDQKYGQISQLVVVPNVVNNIEHVSPLAGVDVANAAPINNQEGIRPIGGIETPFYSPVTIPGAR